MIFIISGFVYFAREFNPHAKWWATILGFLHGCAHFFAIFIIYYFVLLRIGRDPINDSLEFIPFFKTGAYILILGWVLGSTIMGIYLFTTLNLYRRRVAVFALLSVLISSFLIFTMWFNAFSSTLICFSVVLVYFLNDIIPSQKIETLFLHSKESISSLTMQDYKALLRSKTTKTCVLICILISMFLIFTMWFNALLSTFIFFSAGVVVAVYFLNKIFSSLKKEIVFLHSNEAFSSLRVQDYKGFLRFKITKDRLEAFFIGIEV